MITEKNFKQKLFEYAGEKYGERFAEFYCNLKNEFPYNTNPSDGQIHINDFFDWLIIEKPLPHSGKTIVEEYIENHQDLEPQMKEKLHQMKNVTRSEFTILSKNGLKLRIKDTHSEKVHEVQLYREHEYLDEGNTLTGRIHPFGDSYRFAGIFQIHKNRPFILNPNGMMEMYNNSRIKEAESVMLSHNSKLTAILNKYPLQWIDGICNKLSIDTKGKRRDKVKEIEYKLHTNLPEIIKSLPEKSIDALKLVLDNGGVAKYNLLRNYDDDISFWWNEHPPCSTIALLRLTGLLTVGKVPMMSRMHKAALIPSDIRYALETLLKRKTSPTTKD